MIERMMVLIGFALALGAGYAVWRLAVRRQVYRLPRWERAKAQATILYFTTPQCVQCRRQQTPILEELVRWLGSDGLAVEKIDATSRPDLAARYRVLTVPTTVVVDHTGKPTAINHGLASLETLMGQVGPLLRGIDRVAARSSYPRGRAV